MVNTNSQALAEHGFRTGDERDGHQSWYHRNAPGHTLVTSPGNKWSHHVSAVVNGAQSSKKQASGVGPDSLRQHLTKEFKPVQRSRKEGASVEKVSRALATEIAATKAFAALPANARRIYLTAFPESRFNEKAALDLHIKKGALHEKLGIPEYEHIPEKRLQSAKHSKDPTERKEATLAENMKHWKH